MKTGFANHFEDYAQLHWHYRVWKLVCYFDQAVALALQELDTESAQELRDFWRAGIVEFHLYFVQPLLSGT